MPRPFDPSLIPEPEGPRAYTVTELNHLARRLLERNFASVWVAGEISNANRNMSSGHLYFTLKDEESQISAVMWNDSVEALSFEVESGMEVLAFGNVTVYGKTGRYQVVVRTLEPRGVGALELAFRQLRDRLEKEGLFDPARKRPLPWLPRRIALVTSRTGAAVRDMMKGIFDRFPRADVALFPVQVQGARAAGEIAAAIRALNAAEDIDVIVIGRGGGSLEDLWAFNEEPLARAIYESRTPVVSAVGHERDVTISDLVADARAMTPTGVGALVVPDEAEILHRLERARNVLVAGLASKSVAAKAGLDYAWRHPAFARPAALLDPFKMRLSEAGLLASRSLGFLIQSCRERLTRSGAVLESLSPLSVLSRGFSVTRDSRGRVLKSAREARKGQRIETILADGRLESVVERIIESEGTGDA